MILTSSCKRILKNLHTDRYDIINCFGNSKPHRKNIGNTTLPMFYFDDHLPHYYIGILINYVLSGKYREIYILLCKLLYGSRYFLHFCKLLSYLVYDTWVPENGEAEGLNLCASAIAHTIEHFASKFLNISKKNLHNCTRDDILTQGKKKKRSCSDMTSAQVDMYMNKNFDTNLTKIHNMISVHHPRHTCLLSKSRYTLQHKPLTILKRKLSSDENTIVTKRIKSGLQPESIYEKITPSINYVRQVSVIELCFMQAAKLSTSSLFSLLLSISDVPLDVDSNYVISGLIDMARSRLRVKFIEVNKEYCTCHSKCTGYKLSHVLREEFESKGLKRSTTIFCCQRCMLSPLVWNTKAKKPRMKICASNPSLETCSLDNSNFSYGVPLYTANYKGFGRFQYQHLFYMTNITNVIEELNDKCPTGPSSQLYGMCFGGQRICQARLKANICSSRKQQHNISCKDKVRYMCTSCTKKNFHRIDYFDSSQVLFGRSMFDRGTCIDKALDDLERNQCISHVINDICTGCKIKFLCAHTSLLISKSITNINILEDPLLFKRSIKRAKLTNYIRYHLITKDVQSYSNSS